MTSKKRDIYIRQFINVTFIVAIPIGYFLFGRFDYVSSGFFLIIPLGFLLSLLMIFRTFVMVYRRGISWVEVLLPILLLVVAIVYIGTVDPYTTGRNALFRAWEPQFDEFVNTASIDSGESLEWIPPPSALSNSAIRVAFGRRFDDGSILVEVITGGGAGGFVYASEYSDAVVEYLDEKEPYRWRVAEHWEAFSR